MAAKTYEVINGINFGEERRESGDTVKHSELPERSVKWLLSGGHIKPVKEKSNGGKSR